MGERWDAGRPSVSSGWKSLCGVATTSGLEFELPAQCDALEQRFDGGSLPRLCDPFRKRTLFGSAFHHGPDMLFFG